MNTPKLRHVRYGHFNRVRHSKFLLMWLHNQSIRLYGESNSEKVYNLLKSGLSCQQVEALPDFVPTPDPES